MGLPMLVIVGVIIMSIGIPAFFVGLLANWFDFWVACAIFIFSFILPMFLFYIEFSNRRKFPIRCTVSYQVGGEMGHKNTYSTDDRIGYVEIKDEKGAKTGAKEWRLMDINKPVQNFDYSFVGDKAIWFGFKIARHCHIVAVMGEKGEEFYPQRYDSSMRDYKAVFDGDRGLRLFKIFQDIQNRNKYTNWLQQNLMALASMGLSLLIAIMLFLCFLQLSDVSKVLSTALAQNNACLTANAYFQNATGFNKTASQPTAAKGNNIAGIPFAFG